MGDIPGMKAGVIVGDVAWNLLRFAKAKGFAIPAFNCTGSSPCNAILEAAAKIGRPIMIQFSEGGSAFFCGKGLPNQKKEASVLGACAGAHYVRNVAPAYGIPVLVHSDHCSFQANSCSCRACNELARVVANRFFIFLCSRAKQAGFMDMAPPKAYVPDFTKAVDHFCIHAGGRAVLDGVQKNLGLNDNHMKASRETLFDWGNTSSSSIWYEAEWIERFGDLKKGQRILQVTFGSGFKCNSAVWSVLKVDNKKLLRPIKQQDAAPPSLLGARRAVSGKALLSEDPSKEAKVAPGL